MNLPHPKVKRKVLFIETYIDEVREAIENANDHAKRKLVRKMRKYYGYSNKTTDSDIWWQIELTYLRIYTNIYE